MCIDKNIQKGRTDCPVCSNELGVNSAAELPVNFVLEELLHKAAISTFLTKTSESDNEMCSKHKESPLYFHCESHNVKVCHSCTVIDHPVVSCRLLSLDQVDDKCKKMKQTQIAAILDQRSA